MTSHITTNIHVDYGDNPSRYDDEPCLRFGGVTLHFRSAEEGRRWTKLATALFQDRVAPGQSPGQPGPGQAPERASAVLTAAMATPTILPGQVVTDEAAPIDLGDISPFDAGITHVVTSPTSAAPEPAEETS